MWHGLIEIQTKKNTSEAFYIRQQKRKHLRETAQRQLVAVMMLLVGDVNVLVMMLFVGDDNVLVRACCICCCSQSELLLYLLLLLLIFSSLLCLLLFYCWYLEYFSAGYSRLWCSQAFYASSSYSGEQHYSEQEGTVQMILWYHI